MITVAHRFITAAAIGAAGGAVALSITWADGGFPDDAGFIRVATAGAFLSGLILAPAFGGPGARGWFLSGVSFGLATLLGAFFAVLLLPLEAALSAAEPVQLLQSWATEALLGPVYVAAMCVQHAPVLLSWGGAIFAIHKLSSGSTSRR